MGNGGSQSTDANGTMAMTMMSDARAKRDATLIDRHPASNRGAWENTVADFCTAALSSTPEPRVGLGSPFQACVPAAMAEEGLAGQMVGGSSTAIAAGGVQK